MKLNITPTFAVMLKTLARQNNAEVEEYIEELILSEYQKKKVSGAKLMNVVFSPIISEKLKILMLKGHRITDTSSSGASKFLSKKIDEEYKSLNLPEY